ncbi:PepSY domain-containing protein [Hankyongella ginsenosidimutans]|uniref:PepSY domain-containing protein n=1 Tax=Hankyongella ginsenosidimutans TaxID=1763828 RepID=A0A4D7C8C4_9SPHN|nr:PepSY domain-containing protein [Hankyongella ginsenosidimutans]QCI78847.1 PepSY domain-containing protein [Hankyongella ginsenosidimutans]TXG84028.1 MAG: PepSY domain-containing protein [Sphingomonadales bacterium]
MKTIAPLLALSILLAGAGPALATGLLTCEAGDPKGWVSQDDLKARLGKQGWEVTKIKVDGGCYEVYGRTPEGDRVEAYFHPVTLEKLLVARRGQILFRKDAK